MRKNFPDCRFSLWRRIILMGQLFLLSVFVEAIKMTPLASRSLVGTGNEIATLNYNNSFSTEDNYRQNFCDRYSTMSNSSNKSSSIAAALNGMQLNVMIKGTKESGYFHYDVNTGIDPEHPGFYATILDTIAEKGNFTWRNSFGYIENVDFSNRSDSYTEFIEWGVDNYDILIGDWDSTPERIDAGINFCFPFHDLELIMIRSKEQPRPKQINLTNWLIPFKPEVWFVLLATIIMSCFVYQFLEYMGEQRHQRSMRQWTMDNLYLGCMNFTQNFEYEANTLSVRVFSVFFSFWALLIVAAYTANLASLLVERSAKSDQVNTIEEAIALNYRICIEANTGSEKHMKQRYPLSEQFLRPYETDEKMYDALNNEECDIMVGYSNLYELYELKQEYNPSCSLVQEGQKVLELYQSFATKLDACKKCSSLVKGVFNYYIQIMYDDGTLQEQWDVHVNKESTRQSCDNFATTSKNKYDDEKKKSIVNDVDSTDVNRRYLAQTGLTSFSKSSETSKDVSEESFTLRQMAGTFLVPCVGAAIATLCSLLSLFEKKKNVKRHGKKQCSTDVSINTPISRNSTTELIQDQLDCIKFSQETTTKSMQDQFDHIKLSQENTNSTTESIQDQLDMIVLMIKNIQENLDNASSTV